MTANCNSAFRFQSYVGGTGEPMTTPVEVRTAAVQHGLQKKRNNAAVAILSGALPGIIIGHYVSPHWQSWAAGILIGLLWGNGFEYAYHRWLLHRPRSSFAKGHLEHHKNIGTAEEPEHVSLGRRPVHIALLFVSNGIPLITADLALGLKMASGIFLGWTIYLIAAEEIHWRIHMDGWLPRGLRYARAYHMSHHDVPNTRYNVFLPLFDYLLGNTALPVVTRPTTVKS